MILLDMLHAKAKRVVFENISMVRRRACCAPGVMLEFYEVRSHKNNHQRRTCPLRLELQPCVVQAAG